MKIALIGYGKMGREVEQIALQRHHSIALKISDTNLQNFTIENLKQCDIAIEFSTPQSAVSNFETCFAASIPVVCGTTGWYEMLNNVKSLCEQRNASFLYASNFSMGVNMLFELNKKLASMMNQVSGYHPAITEIHHIHKKDKPSGTAITLAKGIIENLGTIEKYALDKSAAGLNEVNIECIREDEVVGTHFVKYTSDIDSIQISHEAYSRKGFAAGAVLAAEWLKDKKGFYEMNDFVKDIFK